MSAKKQTTKKKKTTKNQVNKKIKNNSNSIIEVLLILIGCVICGILLFMLINTVETATPSTYTNNSTIEKQAPTLIRYGYKKYGHDLDMNKILHNLYYDTYKDKISYIAPVKYDDITDKNIVFTANVLYDYGDSGKVIHYRFTFNKDKYGNCTLSKKPEQINELEFIDKKHREEILKAIVEDYNLIKEKEN